MSEYTNIYIVKNFGNDNRRCRQTDVMEIRGFFGLLIAFGAGKLGKGNLKYLWHDKRGKNWKLCTALMSYSRYQFLLRCIHFDDISTRKDRVTVDNFGIMRELFTYIELRFRMYYEPGIELCIDEQLLKFRGRSKLNSTFHQSLPRMV